VQRSQRQSPVFRTSIRLMTCSLVALACCIGVSKVNGQMHAAIPETADRFVPLTEDPVLVEAKRAVRLRDFEKAVRLWDAAARRGNPRAQYRLGVSYRSGRGVDKDSNKAAFWFGKAALAGDPDARYALGKLYESGRGVERDRDRAIELIGLAARSGHREAKRSLERFQRSRSVAYATASGRVAANQKDPRAALSQAIRMGDRGSAQEALARGAPINGAPGDSRHWRPLILAIDQDRPEIVELLIERGADPNRESRIGEPPLILAIRSRNVRTVRSMLAAGSHPATRSISGTTPLMEAARLGLAEISRALIAARADPTATLDDDTSAADIARRFGFDALATRLQRAGAPVRDAGVTAGRRALLDASEGGARSAGGVGLPPLLEAARRGDAALVRNLLASGASLDTQGPDGDSALHWAADGGYADATRALLEAGIHPDVRGRNAATPLMRAMASASPGSEDVVAVLCNGGADPHKRDDSSAGLIDYAASGATPKKLASIRAAGASWTDADVARALRNASTSGRIETARALIAITASPADRMVALCDAISTGRNELLDLLLSGEISLDRPCEAGQTILFKAAQAGRDDVVEQLLEIGANPNTEADNGDTALIAAASRGFTAIVSQLIRSGANVSHRGSHRMTALMGAAANGRKEAVQLLLDAGADRRMRGESGRTASDLAEAAGHAEIVAAIEAARPEWRAWFGASKASRNP